MQLTKEQQKKLLTFLVIVLGCLAAYRMLSFDAPRTMPLQYTRGMKVAAPLRGGIAAPGAERDPIALVLAKRIEQYPGVARDLFHLQGDGTVRKPKAVPPPVTSVATPAPLPEPATTPTPTVPQKSPEEIAADNAREDLSTFRFLGYLTDKDSSLFLSKDGELFIAKSGDRLLKNYRVKESGKDFVVLQDTVTKVEVRIELTGSGDAKPRADFAPPIRR